MNRVVQLSYCQHGDFVINMNNQIKYIKYCRKINFYKINLHKLYKNNKIYKWDLHKQCRNINTRKTQDLLKIWIGLD